MGSGTKDTHGKVTSQQLHNNNNNNNNTNNNNNNNTNNNNNNNNNTKFIKRHNADRRLQRRLSKCVAAKYAHSYSVRQNSPWYEWCRAYTITNSP